jgi:hypothetical protein
MIQNNSVNNSISGATALKLDEQFAVDESQEFNLNTQKETIIQKNSEERFLNTSENTSFESEINTDTSPDQTSFEIDSITQAPLNEGIVLSTEEERIPKIFSEETSSEENNISSSEPEQRLFDQENSKEEDFEIPAFLRRQKF